MASSKKPYKGDCGHVRDFKPMAYCHECDQVVYLKWRASYRVSKQQWAVIRSLVAREHRRHKNLKRLLATVKRHEVL